MAKEKVKFEVKPFLDDQQRFVKGIFIDDKYFDWGVDEGNLKEARERAAKLSKDISPQAGNAYLQSIKDSIQKHFLESLSEFMGRIVTESEVNEATKTGFIDK
jgi:hypothetical protein